MKDVEPLFYLLLPINLVSKLTRTSNAIVKENISLNLIKVVEKNKYPRNLPYF